MWQTEFVIKQLAAAWPGLSCETVPFFTEGDRTLDRPLPEIAGKGVFTTELEEALCAGTIDLAIHSLKDLPVEDTPGLVIGAILGRTEVRDALVARKGWTLTTLPQGALVGTSSIRRQAQLLATRPDLTIRPIRGNVDTRVRKVLDGHYDAAVLAATGLARLGLTHTITEILTLEVMLPAPGQGALAVQCRSDDLSTLCYLAAIDEPETRLAVQTERTFLSRLGGSCSAPVGAYAYVLPDGQVRLEAMIATADGSHVVRLDGMDSDSSLGVGLADEALAQGARESLLKGKDEG
jgi:hydroxymethylbilane synthase